MWLRLAAWVRLPNGAKLGDLGTSTFDAQMELVHLVRWICGRYERADLLSDRMDRLPRSCRVCAAHDYSYMHG